MVNVELGVIVKFVAPEQATVWVMPWPNSNGVSELSEIFAARVVCRKLPPEK